MVKLTGTLALLAAMAGAGLSGQQPAATGAAGAGGLPEPMNWTTAQDHQDMLRQLGIKALRPGPSGNENAPNHANYDEAAANPFPRLPEVLTLADGRRVASQEMWWKQRRPEIVEEFEREVVGRIPRTVPQVTWMVTNTVEATVAGRPVTGKQLVGRVDNSSYPLITVEIQATLVTPANARGPVPVMMMFGGRGLPGTPGAAPPAGTGPPRSLLKGVLANALNPHPYLFWITVGAPLMLKALNLGVPALIAFLGAFYACLLGAKILLAFLVGRSRRFLAGRVYLYTLRGLGLLLGGLALFLFRDGLKLLGWI